MMSASASTSSAPSGTDNCKILKRFECPWLSKSPPLPATVTQTSATSRPNGRRSGKSAKSKIHQCHLGLDRECPFGGHLSKRPFTRSLVPTITASGESELLKVHESLCPLNLINNCDEVVEILGQNEVFRCSNGYHIEPSEMLQLDKFFEKCAIIALGMMDGKRKQTHSEQTCKKKPRNRPEPPENCGICLEHLTPPFGLQQNCPHVYHSRCLITWYQTISSPNGEFSGYVDQRRNRCPLCRQRSSLIINMLSLPLSENEKMSWFCNQEEMNQASYYRIVPDPPVITRRPYPYRYLLMRR